MKQWKKSVRRMCFLLAAIIAVTGFAPEAAGISSVQAAAAKKKTSAKSNYKKLYKDFLKSGITIGSGAYRRKYAIGSFYLLDIDKNGTPELIVKTEKPQVAMSVHYVYTVKKGKLAKIGEYGQKGDNKIYYSSKHKSLRYWWWTNGVGGVGEALLRISKGKLKEYKTIWEGNESMYSTKKEYLYSTNGGKTKKISKSKYKSYYKKYFKGVKKYSFLGNTEKNRTAKLGK